MSQSKGRSTCDEHIVRSISIHHLAKGSRGTVISLLLLLSITLCSQAPKYLIYNYTVDDGLPSNECHGVEQDSLGNIWIATDRGLVKWDGYTFHNYGSRDGLADQSCLYLYRDHHDRMWVNTLSNRLYYHDPEDQQIHAYPYQDRLPTPSMIGYFHIDSLDRLVYSLVERNILVVDTSGYVVAHDTRVDSFEHYVIIDFDGHHYISENILLKELVDEEKYESWTEYAKEVKVYWKGSVELPCPILPDPKFHSNRQRAFSLPGGVIATFIYGKRYLIQDGRLLHCDHIGGNISYLVSDSKGGIYSAEHEKEGVKYFADVDDFIANVHNLLLPDVSANDILIDNQGNLWVATLDHGLFYLRKTFLSKITDQPTTSMTVGDGRLFVTEEKHRVVQIDSHMRRTHVQEFGVEVGDLNYDHTNSRLLVAGRRSAYAEKDQNYSNYQYFRTSSGYINKGAFISLSHAYDLAPLYPLILGSNSDWSAIIDRNSTEKMFYGEYDQGIYDAVVKDGRVYVATRTGLKELCIYDTPPFQGESYIEHIRVSDLQSLGNLLLIGTIGAGIYIWDYEDDWRQITSKEGLISDNIEQIKLNGSYIIASSKQGMSLITGDGGDYRVIKNYTINNELETNDILDIAVMHERAFIGTSLGLYSLEIDTTLGARHIPRITDVSYDGSILRTSTMTHDQNNIAINYIGLDHEQQGNILYRYRINDASWFETKNTSARFSALEPGKYQFFLQAQSGDGVWSPSTSYTFEIRPPWWQSWWAYLLYVGVIAGGLSGWFRWQSKRLQKEIMVKDEIRHLELSALQAQMNPHFIFNSLNSIQRFIISRDTDNAMDFLSRFAKLIRDTLNSTASREISVLQEIRILENYISIEKLRHKDRFEYDIICDPDIDQVHTMIPPMMIQPFVENAIIHGVGDLERVGYIEVRFLYLDDGILVEVEDNGVGTDKKNKKLSTHVSLSSSITAKRLKLITASDHSIQVSLPPSGSGTLVSLKLTTHQI